MSLENQRNWLRLAMVSGMSFGGSYALLKAFGLPETIFAQSVLSLSTVLPQELAMLVHRSPGEDVETKIQTILAWIKNIPQVRLLVPSDKDFPKRFLTVPQPPLVVLAAGDVKLLSRKTVSLVGSSHPSADAELTTQSWVSALIKKELSLIQGEAPGIEKIGLLTALKSKVPSLVIVSKNPLTDDNFEQKLSFILNKGLLISPLEVSEDPWLMRQRLLVASTDHFVVIESSIRSRVLSLVREAADAGRNVMAVPGSIHSPLSKGCHKLIREGAKLVESADDIWDEIKN
jgi:DNA processing protein